ncbi:tyrosine-protein phosphatase non-receptor type substrate 1-like [Esox lucius]|uniref:tyrosine-protein phosphatase non-receptor type substrate 1-like n=1 Tax=Esox lucius TaxID=8010 RepID=UPI001476F14E|nr:tyrosine-protein phosphatase non-receptor type substrate 1-like [Esox lucius]
MTDILFLCVLLLIVSSIPARLQMVTADGLKVGQWPPSLTVMRGQSANLSCRFEAASYGVEWFKMEGGKKVPIPDSAGQTSLVITEVCMEDEGVYYCEVNVLHRDPELGNGTELIVLAPPSAPQLLLQVPSNTQTDRWALVCVTGGFHPNHLTLTWTEQSAGHGSHDHVGSSCTLRPNQNHVNQSHGQLPEISTPIRMEDCFQLTDISRKEVYLISVLYLPKRLFVDAGVSYTCTVQDHPGLDSALSASFSWGAAPNEVIRCLNILKICVLCGITLVFFVAALTRLST